MPSRYTKLAHITFCSAILIGSIASSDQELLRVHCAKCHSGNNPKGDFALKALSVEDESELHRWETAIDYVKSGEMPPAKNSQLSAVERERIIAFLERGLRARDNRLKKRYRAETRRLNNREFENTMRDVLLIEDVGTHLPTDNLIGDSRFKGFDTHGDTLGFSKYHLEEYVNAIRKIVDATILSGTRPQVKRYEIASTDIYSSHTSQNIQRPERRGTAKGFDFLDPKQLAYFKSFKTAPQTGYYRITIRCTGKDRGVYDSSDTGIFQDDPIQLRVRLGGRQRDFNLPDEEIVELQLTEWIAAGSNLQLKYPTDGLRLRGNGNFKFQHAITGQYLKRHNPPMYEKVVSNIKPNKARRIRSPDSWHHWVDHWMGARPRILSATVEGPFFQTWPPKRQAALIGDSPNVKNAEAILAPIARRAWRREIDAGDLDHIVNLVHSKAATLSDIDALKEGIIAVLASPQCLLLNLEKTSAPDRFAAKMSYFLSSTLPDEHLRSLVNQGKLNTFTAIRSEIRRRLEQSEIDPFLNAFPYAWLELSDINFMAPDPDHFRHYHRKSVSEDMVDEALHFFKHAVEHNIPLPEFLSADYSFVNADLAKVYGLSDVPEDSVFRKYTFNDQRRGGLLGMGAFLTSTADSLGTSPIHRAIYVMENFLGLHPSPPPPDVKIEEPDVRSAVTIKEVLEAHRSDESCASCHQAIDPFGYAFENFDPMGAWRDEYSISMPDAKPQKSRTQIIPIDSSASFQNGTQYNDIVGFRKLMQSTTNQERFVRCFIEKLLTYANGEEPESYFEVENILRRSAENEYRIVDTIAAVVESPLFREP